MGGDGAAARGPGGREREGLAGRFWLGAGLSAGRVPSPPALARSVRLRAFSSAPCGAAAPVVSSPARRERKIPFPWETGVGGGVAGDGDPARRREGSGRRVAGEGCRAPGLQGQKR